MNGFEKIAVLLGELGMEASENIVSRLHLSDGELAEIKKNLARLGPYNPHDPYQVARENSVLEELKQFGMARGIYRDVPHDGFVKTGSAQNNIFNMAQQNPEDIAMVLKSWLSET